MPIRMAGKEAHLEGDWTLTEVTRNLDSLALSLQQLESESEKNLRIYCGQIKEADICGLQLLNVLPIRIKIASAQTWMESRP